MVKKSNTTEPIYLRQAMYSVKKKLCAFLYMINKFHILKMSVRLLQTIVGSICVPNILSIMQQVLYLYIHNSRYPLVIIRTRKVGKYILCITLKKYTSFLVSETLILFKLCTSCKIFTVTYTLQLKIVQTYLILIGGCPCLCGQHGFLWIHFFVL